MEATTEDFEVGIFHTMYCPVCDDPPQLRQMWETWGKIPRMLKHIWDRLLDVVWIINIIAAIVIVVGGLYYTGYFLARGLEWKRPPIQQIGDKYEMFTLYEDGSYRAKTIDGKEVVGCLRGRICND